MSIFEEYRAVNISITWNVVLLSGKNIKTFNYNTPPLLCRVQITGKHWGKLPDLLHINACTKFGQNSLTFTRYRPEMNIRACLGQIILSKFDEICPSAIPNQTSTISMTYQVWRKSIDVYSSYLPEMKIWACLGQITPSKSGEICPLAIPNQISIISIHIPNLVKIH